MLLILGPLPAFSQEKDSLHLPYFDSKRVHFGFMFSFEQASYKLTEKPMYRDSVMVTAKGRPGFSIGLLATCRLTRFLWARLTPNIDFQERNLVYTLPNPGSQLYKYGRKVEATNICFPLQLKLRSKRAGNIAFSALGGAYYSVDIEYNRVYTNYIAPLSLQTVQTNKNDYGYNAGAGIEFFLRYYKMSLEIKYQAGLLNVLLQDNNYFTSPIQSLKTSCWMLSVVFEG
jgi:hypothetical protein